MTIDEIDIFAIYLVFIIHRLSFPVFRLDRRLKKVVKIK